MGMEVNFALRLETLAASLGEACGLSDAASSRLEGLFHGGSLAISN
jgi:class 3 adenylate cyclase